MKCEKIQKPKYSEMFIINHEILIIISMKNIKTKQNIYANTLFKYEQYEVKFKLLTRIIQISRLFVFYYINNI